MTGEQIERFIDKLGAHGTSNCLSDYIADEGRSRSRKDFEKMRKIPPEEIARRRAD